MAWSVDGKLKPGILTLRLEGHIGDDDMSAFVNSHNRAIDAFAGTEYRVFCDVRELKPLSPSGTALFEKAKAYSAQHPNFQGSAVLVSSSIISMQHRRTSVSSGVMETELITDDEAACTAHLARVKRIG